jgi:hypothetical protein
MIVFGMVCKKDLKKQQRRKSVYKIGYDHNNKTERLIINNIIVVVVVLLFSFCITVLLYCFRFGLCGCAVGWFVVRLVGLWET